MKAWEILGQARTPDRATMTLTRSGDEYVIRVDGQQLMSSRMHGSEDALAAMAKLHASNCSFECANRSVQVFGSAAYRKTSRVARHFLDSRATTIYEGANEVLELKIASGVLGHSAY